MNPALQKFITELPRTEPDLSALYELTDTVEKEEDLSPAFSSIFRYMEEHSDDDLGSPGPLVHLMEKAYPKYLIELIDSVSRKPTPHTVWMINRILNAEIEAKLREELTETLESVALNDVADDYTKNQARNFLIHQKEKLG